MTTRLRSWWQQLKQHRGGIGVVGIALVVVIALMIVGYWFDWTGFNGYNQVTTAHTISGPSAGTVIRTEVYQSGKSLWDWLQLLIIPLVLAVGALLFNLATTRTEQTVALDKQREDLLQVYLDRMSELLLEKDLRQSQNDAEVRNVARARTLTVLPRLDAERKSSLIQFLSESQLLSIINLSGANLSGVNLSGADLSHADLSHADLSHADLIGVTLEGAKLISANLSHANLGHADLSGANLSGANLSGAYLEYATLSDADLSGAYLFYANLEHAELGGADLRGTELGGADLGEANNVTATQLDYVKSLLGATLPDGSIHP